MKLRDMMFLVIGGLLVISGMVLNALLSSDAEAQGGVKDAVFRNVYCRNLTIQDGYKMRGAFALDTDGDAILTMYGDDGKTPVAYLGTNDASPTNEMMLQLQSKSQTDKRKVMMQIDEHGGKLDSFNKMGESVVRIAVHSDGGGAMQTYDKFGYRR